MWNCIRKRLQFRLLAGAPPCARAARRRAGCRDPHGRLQLGAAATTSPTSEPFKPPQEADLGPIWVRAGSEGPECFELSI